MYSPSLTFLHPFPALLFLLAATGLVLPGCQSTAFPPNPRAHPLWEEIQAAPHPYYALVRTGFRSRVLGLLPEEEMRRLLDDVHDQWAAIDRLNTADSLRNYFNTHGLNPFAERIAATLAANASNTPPGGVDARLEAGALKVGLIEAYYEVQRAP